MTYTGEINLAQLANLTEDEQLLYTLIQNSHKSWLKGMYVKNFGSLEEGRIEFDEKGNIIQLVGYNDSGKTAFLRASAVLYYDHQPTKQVDMIHDVNGAREFEVGMWYDDGVTISKIKRISGESIWTLKHADKVLYTNQKDTSLIAVKGVPEVIRKYNKVVYEEVTKEYVNYRQNRDKLFLVHTGNGENAKIINGLLKLDVVTEAITRLNKEKNRLMTSLSSTNSSITTLKNMLNATEVMAESEELKLASSVKNLQNISERLLLVSKTITLREKIESNRPYKPVDTVDTERLLDLEHVKTLRGALEKPIIPVVEEVNYQQLQELQRIKAIRETIGKNIIPAVESVDTGRLEQITKLLDLRKKVTSGVQPDVNIIETVRLQEMEKLVALRKEIEDVTVIPSVDKVETDRLKDITFIMNLLKVSQEAQSKLDKVISEEQVTLQKVEEYKTKYDLRTCGNCGVLTA